jgi:hypothetical protein
MHGLASNSCVKVAQDARLGTQLLDHFGLDRIQFLFGPYILEQVAQTVYVIEELLAHGGPDHHVVLSELTFATEELCEDSAFSDMKGASSKGLHAGNKT